MKQRILVAPLNWGIGHACRCIPIINALLENNFEVVIASDGEALCLLKKEFPNLEFTELPSYNVTYSKNKSQFKRHLIKQLPKIYFAIRAEHKATQHIIKTFKIDAIISDNRLGVYSKKLKSVFITHQLHVLSGKTTALSSKLHEYFIKNFDACWVPDFEGLPNLSGKLSHSTAKKQPIPITYIGALSRLELLKTESKTDILVLLSGPEPQRNLLALKLLKELKKTSKKIIFVKGVLEDNQTKTIEGTITIYNFLTTKDLQIALNEANLVICRSGYTSVMDLAKLNKKVFFIPTPGQYEQEYLAHHLEEQKIAPFCNQDDFTLEQLNTVKTYKGFQNLDFEKDLDKRLFDWFR
jgi:uncharacterized protein (TIGR00661 family)